MKLFSFFFVLIFSVGNFVSADELCGRVSFKGRDKSSVILADLQSEAEPIYFLVSNPGVHQWQEGSCVCARGTASCTKTASSCEFFVRKITSVDLNGTDCLPTWFP